MQGLLMLPTQSTSTLGLGEIQFRSCIETSGDTVVPGEEICLEVKFNALCNMEVYMK